MPNTQLLMDRIARDAVRVRFDPESGLGTAVFLVHVAREIGAAADEMDRAKVLLAAKSVAESFIASVNREMRAQNGSGTSPTP